MAGLFLFLGFSFSLKAQWQLWHKCEGLYGGDAKSILKVDSMLFTGVFRGGVYRSLDSGKTWGNPSKEEFYNVVSLVYKDSMLFASDLFGEGVFRSDNYGVTWEKVFEYPMVTCILITGDTIFVTHDFGVEISTDYGETWQYANTGFNGPPLVEDITYANGKYYAATNDGIYYAEDSLNWICINGNLPSGQYVRRVYLCDQGIFISCPHKGIYYSSDHGEFWDLRNNGLPEYNWVNDFRTNDTALFICTSNGLFFSEDLGITWKSLNNNLPKIKINDLYFLNDEIYICSQAGILRLNKDSGQWTLHNNNMQNSRIYSILDKGDTIIAATYLGVQYSYDNGESWHIMYDGLDYGEINKLACYKNTIIGLNFSNDIIYKLDNMNGPWQNFSHGINVIYIYSIHTLDSTFLAATNLGFYTRSLNDTIWNPTGTELPFNGYGITTVSGNKIYSGDQEEDQVYWSDNLGNTWHQCSSISQDYCSLYYLSSSDSTVYAGCSNGLYKYIKEKDVWKNLHVSDENHYFYTAAIQHPYIFTYGHYYGFHQKPFLSVNNGFSFSNISGVINFSGYEVFSLLIHNNSLYMGTKGRSLWKRDDLITETGPVTFLPETNIVIYPNPATNKTFIKSDEIMKIIKIYNQNGQMVLLENINNDFYELNTSKLSTGVYFIKVETKTGGVTKRLIVR